ncbi:MAG: hypothetical protein K8L91_33650 [Anaerolineae bacterium]|nr:hypothetical protein [Anaerolineae bacterium]
MMRVIGFLGVVLMLLSGTLVVARRDEPEQWIAFISNRDGNPEIYRMRPDGSDVRQLTFTTVDRVHCWVRWSRQWDRLYFADGEFVADQYDCDYTHSLPDHFRIRADGTYLTAVSRNYATVWSSNEEWFLTQDWDRIRGVNLIYRENNDGSERYFLHEGRRPRWSPNGNWIVFLSDELEGLYVMHPNGQSVKRLNLDDFEIYDEIAYVWAGDRVIFLGSPLSSSIPGGLYAIDVDTQEIEWIGDMGYVLDFNWLQLTLSPNGQWLAYKDYWIGVVDLSSGENTRLADFNLPEGASYYGLGAFSWSPDSQWIVFSKFDEAGRSKIWRIHPDGTGLEQMTFGPGEDLRPAWSPVIDMAWNGWGLMGIGAGLVAGVGLGRRWR